MSVISGVKSSPKRGGSGLRKGEKPPRFGVKTDQEPELSTVSCKKVGNTVEPLFKGSISRRQTVA